MSTYSIEKLYQLYKKHPIICTDTRQIEPNSIFVALKGENFDANNFVNVALEKGCAYAIVDNPSQSKDSRCILVENSLQTLQALANFHRKQLAIPIIGITGTNGKTTTKELIRSVLSVKYKVYATEGNFNNHLGVPLTLLRIPLDAEMVIVEMGANHLGEIGELCAIAEPNYGLITNIGKAHLEGFGSFQGVIQTKTDLYRWIQKMDGLLFVNADNPILMQYSAENKRICMA
ncbi:MAG: Mur ligase family protein [Bacteroidales bacterium]